MVELTITFSPTNRHLVHSLLHDLGLGALVEGIPGTDLVHVDSAVTCYPQSEQEERSIRETLLTAVEGDPELKFTSNLIPDSDWASAWKEHWQPIAVTDRLWIAPTWYDFTPPPESQTIWLDTTSAFGTGSHETTRMCLRLISEQLDRSVHNSFLDIGCGSGVLAIGAYLAGATEISGLDIDPLAVETAQRNAERNNCSSISFIAARAEEISLSADFVAANLLSGIIRQSWNSIMRSVKPNGLLVLSGILSEELPQLLADLRVIPQQVLTEGEWCAVLLRPDRGARPG